MRLNLCISRSRRSSSIGAKSGTGGGSLTNAVSCISEPMGFLLKVATAAVTAMEGNNDGDALRQMLDAVRSNFSRSNLSSYLSANEGVTNSQEELATCLLVTSVTEVLMDIPLHSESTLVVEKLFELRQDAVGHASVFLSTPTPLKKKLKGKARGKGKKKGNVEQDADEDKNNRTNTSATEQGSEGDGGLTTVYDDGVFVKSKINPATLVKSRRSIEDAVALMTPAPSVNFLESSFRSFSKQDRCREEGKDDDCNSANSNRQYGQLFNDITFRRFLLDKTRILLDEISPELDIGYRLNRISISSSAHGMVGNNIESDSQVTRAQKLGPILFNEFCLHVQSRDSTSLIGCTGDDLMPLAGLALRGFGSCIRIIKTSTVGDDQMLAVSELLENAFQETSLVFPETRVEWDRLMTYEPLLKDSDFGIEGIEMSLLRLLLPFIVPMTLVSQVASTADESSNQGFKPTHCGLLAELVANGMDEEAKDCCNVLNYIVFDLSAGIRKVVSKFIMQCWDKNDTSNPGMGCLRLDHDAALSSQGKCKKSATRAIDLFLLLDGLLDGTTPLLSAPSLPPNHNLRSFLGLPYTSESEKDTTTGLRTEFFEYDSDKQFGSAYRLALAFLAAEGFGTNFDGMIRPKHIEILNDFHLPCVNVAISSDNLTTAATSLVFAVDAALADMEFVTSSILQFNVDWCLCIIQRMLSARLYSVVKIISTLALCAEGLDQRLVVCLCVGVLLVDSLLVCCQLCVKITLV